MNASSAVRRAIVVDDSPTQAMDLRQRLVRGGFHVTIAPSPAEALKIVERQTPDVLLTDLVMQEMDGLELVRRIRRKHPGLPIILLTAAGSEERRGGAAGRSGGLRREEESRPRSVSHAGKCPHAMAGCDRGRTRRQAPHADPIAIRVGSRSGAVRAADRPAASQPAAAEPVRRNGADADRHGLARSARQCRRARKSRGQL